MAVNHRVFANYSQSIIIHAIGTEVKETPSVCRTHLQTFISYAPNRPLLRVLPREKCSHFNSIEEALVVRVLNIGKNAGLP